MVQTRDLLALDGLHRRVAAESKLVGAFFYKLVDPDDDTRAALDRLLGLIGGVGDTRLHPAALNGRDAAAELIDLRRSVFARAR